MQSKDKLGFRKEYVPIIICGIILVFLVGALVLLLTSNNVTNVKIPKVKKYNNIESKISDFQDGVSEKGNLQSFKTENLKTNYRLVSGFKNSGIILEYYDVIMDGDDFIVYSNAGSEQTYVSKVTTDGHISFVTKIPKKVEKKRYFALDINSVVPLNDKYYVFITGIVDENEKSIDNIVITLDKKGKVEETKVIVSGINKKIKNVLLIDNYFSIISVGDSSISINYISDKLDSVKEAYDTEKDNNNPFEVKNSIYRNSIVSNNQIILLISRGYPISGTNYKYYIYVTPGNNDAKWVATNIETEIDSEISEENDAPEIFDTDYYGSVMTSSKIGYYFNETFKIYEYNDNLFNEIKYGELDTGMFVEVEDYTNNKEKVEPVKDNLSVVNMYGNNILLLKNSKMYVVDVFDENMNQIMRYQLDSKYISFKDPDAKKGEEEKVISSIINIFYKDGKLIFVDAYGEGTGALLIYTIGG